MTQDSSGIEIAYYATEWAIRLAMLLIVPFRRSPDATRSWLLLIFFLPIPGLLLFLAIGSTRFPHWRTERFQALHGFFVELCERMSAAAPAPEHSHAAIIPLVQRLGGQPAVGDNAVTLLDSYDGTIDRLVADIDAARHHVRILVYIFADDATGRRIIDALGRAVARGVACHVLIDAVGSHRWARRVQRKLEAAGVSVCLALPFRLLRGRTRRDMRNHRKLFLIDGLIGYAGSQNIIDKDFRPGVTNRELVVRLTGPAVVGMTALFLTDWYLETEELLDRQPAIPERTGDTVVQVLPSGADYPLEGFATLLTWQIHAAQERVTITTPYFIPDQDLLGAMRTAVLRGVKVVLIVSAVADQWLVSMAQRSYYEVLLRAGIEVYRFQDYLLHAKNVSIDGRLAIVGSSNVDIRSFQLNEEVSLLLPDRKAAARVAAVQRDYIDHSALLTLDHWRERSRFQKFGENMARLVSPLL